MGSVRFWSPACWCCCDSSKLSVISSISSKTQLVAITFRAGYEMLLQGIHWMGGELEFSGGPSDVHMDWLNGEEPNIQDHPLKWALPFTVHLGVPKDDRIVRLVWVVVRFVFFDPATNPPSTGRLSDFQNAFT